jgi:lipopolysaccharide heptosyltransferase II
MRPVHKILFITLSNIGDCILTLPVLDDIRAAYPGAAITVFAGARPRELFEHNPAVHDLVIYDKHAPLPAKISLVRSLAAQRYDLVVDLRSSLLGLLLPAKIRAWGRRRGGSAAVHMKDRHRAVISGLHVTGNGVLRGASFSANEADKKTAGDMLKRSGIADTDRIVAISAGARSAIKRWPKEKFASLIDQLSASCSVRIVLIGDRDDVPISRFLSAQARHPVVDLTGRTTLSQTAGLLQRSSLLITNDSANLHLASYCNVPVIAVFGPTDDSKYAPWSQRSAALKKEIFCRPCCAAQCRFGTVLCMHLVTVKDVLRQSRRFLLPEAKARHDVSAAYRGTAAEYKRILVVRTDRMGDMILSTPVLKALRLAYPNAYLAVLVRPYTREVVQGNPYIDEVIVYDKEKYDRNLLRFLSFIGLIRKRRFDCALVLHPTNRDHLITFLSGIRRRIGYDRKMGFLLSDRIVHDKQQGTRHESDYALDMVRFLGIDPQEKEFFVPVDQEAEKWAEGMLADAGIKASDRIVVINPGASCPSKIWPSQRYAAVADELAARGFHTIVLAGPDSLDQNTAAAVMAHMKTKAIDCIGKAPIPQTASLFRRSSLVISADTGPMHIAAAVGVPLIAIFGRNQPGISPKRWGPINANSIVLHKDAGCIECLAHGCVKSFACLAAITVEDVLGAADKLIGVKKNI